jgi:hypothetical protein
VGGSLDGNRVVRIGRRVGRSPPGRLASAKINAFLLSRSTDALNPFAHNLAEPVECALVKYGVGLSVAVLLGSIFC